MLNEHEIALYRANGYLLLDEYFNGEEMDNLSHEYEKLEIRNKDKIIYDRNKNIRSIFYPEEDSELFTRFIRHRKLVKPAEVLLNDKVYAYQTKLNIKKSLESDIFEWHQDFPYWHFNDGMTTSNVLTMMIYLSDVTEEMGPLFVVPGSHEVSIESFYTHTHVRDEELNAGERSYLSSLSSDLKFTLTPEALRTYATRNGIVSLKAKKGSIVIFSGNLFHASNNNLSPFDRKAFLVTYNAVDNVLKKVDNPRPYFLANRDNSPIECLEGDLVEASFT
jgi:ectoine hydroxylase